MSLDNYVRNMAYQIAIHAISEDPYPQGNLPFNRFLERARALNQPKILELGTRRSIPERSTRRDAWFPNAGEYLGADIESGVDVDIVADVHRLSQVTGEEQFDVIFSDAGFEHFKYPHLAALEIMKALKVGGLLFVQTHQTFPIHAVPYDYFRFSREALAGLFGTKMNFCVHETTYSSPAAIYSRVDPGGRDAPAFLHVSLFGEKLGVTPNEYIYEYDC